MEGGCTGARCCTQEHTVCDWASNWKRTVFSTLSCLPDDSLEPGAAGSRDYVISTAGLGAAAADLDEP